MPRGLLMAGGEVRDGEWGGVVETYGGTNEAGERLEWGFFWRAVVGGWGSEGLGGGRHGAEREV